MNKIKKIIKKIKDGFFQDAVSELRWIYQLLADYKWGIAGYTVLTLVSMVITLSFTLQTKTLVDNLVSGSWRGVLYVTVYYVGVGSVNVCLSMLTQRMSAKVSAKVKTEISVKTYRRIISADWEIVTEHHSGDLMTRMHEDIATIATSTVGWIPSVASQMIQIIISAGVIIYYDFSMLFIILLVAPIILIGSRIFLGKMYKSTMKQRNIASEVMSLYKETFQHLQSVKSFGLVPEFDRRMQKKQAVRQDIDLEVNKYSIGSWSVMYVSGQIAALICLGWAVYHVYQGIISLGTMTLLITLASTVATAFHSFIQLIPTAVGTISSAERIRTILDLPEETVENADQYEELYKRSMEQGISLEIDHMDFHYKNGKQVFEDVSCKAEPGEIVAFVGPSGEGKTTMLRILLGIVKAQETIRLSTEGMSLPISTAARRLMAYVPQGNTMMNGTIAENLRMLKPDATEEEIVEALEEACAYEFVRKLPDGIHHNIGESGIGFSEGQNQRLAIARALMCRTPILLLDEATSALDVATERKVLANLMKGQKKRTCILTTHRPSVLTMCDRIYRIASEKVLEIGDDEIREIMNEF